MQRADHHAKMVSCRRSATRLLPQVSRHLQPPPPQLTALTELAGEFSREDYYDYEDLRGDSSDVDEQDQNDMYIPVLEGNVLVSLG
jgi:hypothetical protein